MRAARSNDEGDSPKEEVCNMKERLEQVRQKFFAYTKLGRWLSDRAWVLYQRHPESKVCRKIMNDTLPF